MEQQVRAARGSRAPATVQAFVRAACWLLDGSMAPLAEAVRAPMEDNPLIFALGTMIVCSCSQELEKILAP